MNAFATGLKAGQDRLRRGWILRILNYFNHSDSHEVNDRVIMTGLVQNGHGVSMAALHADLRFLKELGYVHVKEPEGSAIAMVASIAAKGTRLLAGDIEDVSINANVDQA